jgi:hypothetical protein
MTCAKRKVTTELILTDGSAYDGYVAEWLKSQMEESDE